MLQAMSITIREGFEAALVISIMLTYAARTGRTRLKKPIIWGAVAAAIASVVLAFGLGAVGIEPESEAVEGALYVIAAVFVVSMVVWMWRVGGDVHRTVTEGIDRAASGSSAAVWGVGLVSFFMVAREGAETVLFLTANALDQGVIPTLVGGAAGLAVAIGLGMAIYYGAARIDLKIFFTATSVALILLATRFLGIGILELGEAGVFALPETVEATLELLEKGALATILSTAVVALPIAAIGWSLFRHRSPHPAS